MNYDIRIFSALSLGAPVFLCIFSALESGENADRSYQYKSKKCRNSHAYSDSPATRALIFHIISNFLSFKTMKLHHFHFIKTVSISVNTPTNDQVEIMFSSF